MDTKEQKDMKAREAIAAIMKDRNQRHALSELLIEYIQPNHISAEFMSLLMDTKTLSKDDSIIRRIRKGIKVHTWVPGQIALRSEVTVQDRMNWNFDNAIVGLMASQWDLDNGDLGTVADLKNEAMLKLRDWYFTKVFTALTTIWTAANTPNNYTDCAGDITKVALKAMIDYINETTPGAKLIVGVRSAVTPITDFAGFWGDGTTNWGIEPVLEEIVATGMVGRFYGVPILAIDQIYDDPYSNTALLPTNRVLVIGQKVGEFVTYGDVKPKEWVDMEPTPPVWKFDMVQQFGLVIENAMGIGVLAVS